MASDTAEVATALRLGWAVAEVRGRAWPDGPRPAASAPPLEPPDVLPLRSQRRTADAAREARRGLVSAVENLRLDRAGAFEAELRASVPVADDAVARPAPLEGARAAGEGKGEVVRAAEAAGGGAAVGEGEGDAGGRAGPAPPPPWPVTADFFLRWDAWFQDELAQRDEALANAYLLGRGTAECYWGLGAEQDWVVEGRSTAVSPHFLLGEDRRRELTRMLGRLDPALTHSTTPAAISGSLEAWGAVAEDGSWRGGAELRAALHEQMRRWYQLVVLGQDPTTLIQPYAKLSGLRGVGRAARLFWPQLTLFVLASALVAAFFTASGESAPTWVSSVLATSGAGIFVAAGLLARGQSAAQKLLTRLRQDAYTDLVAVSITVVPDRPAADAGNARAVRAARKRLESLVRRRSLTPPTPPPE